MDVQVGDKLAGDWRLVRMWPRTKQGALSWLLIEAQDGVALSATAPGIREDRPLSVISGRGIEASQSRRNAVPHEGVWLGASPTSSSTNLTCELTFMLFIWSGWGILVVPIVVGTAIIVGALAQLSLQALGHPELAFLAFSLGLFAAAALNWVVGRRLNSTPPRELIDPATNESVLLTRRHALFWIRMEYWSVPVVLTAFVPLLALRNL